MESAVAGGGENGATNEEVERLRARVAALEEENDVLALAAAHEPELIADVKRYDIEDHREIVEKTSGIVTQRLQSSGSTLPPRATAVNDCHCLYTCKM